MREDTLRSSSPLPELPDALWQLLFRRGQSEALDLVWQWENRPHLLQYMVTVRRLCHNGLVAMESLFLCFAPARCAVPRLVLSRFESQWSETRSGARCAIHSRLAFARRYALLRRLSYARWNVVCRTETRRRRDEFVSEVAKQVRHRPVTFRRLVFRLLQVTLHDTTAASASLDTLLGLDPESAAR